MTSTWQTTMDAKLETFAGWHLSAFCAGCRVVVQLDVDRLRHAHAGRRWRRSWCACGAAGAGSGRRRCRWRTGT